MIREIACEYAQRFRDLMGRWTFWIYDTKKKEWFIGGLLLLTIIPLMQRKIGTPKEALEQAMRSESMAGVSRQY